LSRQLQKLRTRRSIIDAAFSLLDEQRSLSSISLREVARVAGIAPTSFYRHFKDIDELGLTLVDEAGLALRQLMRQARLRIASGGGVINTSVDTFMEFISDNSNVFRLLLREHTGTSLAFRAAVLREIQHFNVELTDYTKATTGLSSIVANLQAEAMVKLVFSAGAEALDSSIEQRKVLAARLKLQLRFIANGAKQTQVD
jgi:AcrR family transcriptional regulator|tara:strand:+ start:6487 stop:7086 length:600 start_codon:yes stop_codon:yes gene_type:complete